MGTVITDERTGPRRVSTPVVRAVRVEVPDTVDRLVDGVERVGLLNVVNCVGEVEAVGRPGPRRRLSLACV